VKLSNFINLIFPAVMLLMLLIQITLAYQEVNFMICWASHHWVVSLYWCWETRLTRQGLCLNKLWPTKC